VTRIELEFQFVSALLREQGRTTVTPEIVGLQWNTALLYPAGHFTTRIAVAPAVTLPEGWEFGTALEVDERHGAVLHFKPTTLDMLVDSPVFAGRYFKRLDLDPGARVPVHLNLFADSAESLEVRPEQIAAHRKLVRETYALLGPPHYDHYEFLLALSDQFGEIGLEHHRSSEGRRAPGYFTEWDRQSAGRNLLPHELVHSWNGKFRSPAGLATPDFNVPMEDALLWVYEGLTSYLDGVLAARSGLWNEGLTREIWANVAAQMDRNRPGRTWRDLEDTTNQPIITPRQVLSWPSWQRTEDYYGEGQLIWLDVDTKIRELTREKRSLDDFVRAFFSVSPGDGRGAVPYTFADIVQALKEVAAFDWEKLLTQHLRDHSPGAPLDGLTRSGWRLTYGETPSDYTRSLDEQRKAVDFTFSLGFSVAVQTAQLTEVRWGSPAYDVGLTLGTTLVAVNGGEYRPDRLKAAIAAAKLDRQPIELLVRNFDRYRTVRITYFEGVKYPRLERIPDTPDRLAAILKPRT
jgi:predicted metalloprotease with PDZ domain